MDSDYRNWLAIDVELKANGVLDEGSIERIYVREDELDTLPDKIRAALKAWRDVNGTANF